MLSLHAETGSCECPLSLRIAAPRGLFVEDINFKVLQPWSYPHRLVRIAAHLPVEYESLESADRSAAIECFRGNLRIAASLDIPPSAAESCMHTTLTLHSVARDFNDDPGNKCVLIDLPVPENTSLRDGASIVLTVSVAGCPTTLRIPAAGHIHSGTCNHRRVGSGAVLSAACAGDTTALRAALDAGGSTEEADDVRRC